MGIEDEIKVKRNELMEESIGYFVALIMSMIFQVQVLVINYYSKIKSKESFGKFEKNKYFVFCE